MRVCSGFQNVWEHWAQPPCDEGRGCLVRNTTLPHVLPRQCGHPRLNERNYGDPRENLTSRLPLFTVTRTDTNRSATYDFLLVILSNLIMGLS